MSLEEHLSRAGGEGRFDSTGVFTLDRQKALEKLGGFSLERWLHVLYVLGGWLAQDGNSPVDFQLDPGRLTIRRAHTNLTAEQVEHLDDYVLVSGAYRGVSQLAMARHIWLSGGSFVLQAAGCRKVWEKDAARTEPAPEATDLLLQLSHKSIGSDPTDLIEFLAQSFAWTPYTWTFNGLPMAPNNAAGKSVMFYNRPPLSHSIMPGVSLSRPEADFQLYCQWQTDGTSVVVVDGVAYPITRPLLKGLRCVVFCSEVQRDLTRSHAVVSTAQRQAWTRAVQLLVEAFADKAHFWNNREFLTRHAQVFCRALWGSFSHAGCFAAAQRLAAVCPKEEFAALLHGRIATRQGDHLGALYHWRPMAKWELSPELREYVEEVDAEFAGTLAAHAGSTEELKELVDELQVCAEIGPMFPKAVSAFCLQVARAAEELGDITLAERLYLASYFLPRGLNTDWSTFLHVHSFMDMGRDGRPVWLKDMDAREEHLEGVWAAVRLAQQRQSSQLLVTEALGKMFRHSHEPLLEQALNLRRLESWRLERRASQAEWFKWHLVAPLEGVAPKYPPNYYDDTYRVPQYYLGDTAASRLALLRAQTVYLEYAALSYSRATSHGQAAAEARFQAILDRVRQVYQEYEETDQPEELVELGRIAIELGRTEEAAVYLQRAVCKYPPGDFRRLPLLVDMGVLEPHRAHSVLGGLFKVLKVHEFMAGAVEKLATECAWPFPFELPSRLRRLAWQLEGAEALKAYRLARILFRRAFGPSWMETTEQDWVIEAIEILSRQ